MKQIRIIAVCLIFPLIGFSQIEKEAKTMLTSSQQKVNADMQKMIVGNTWKMIYRYGGKSMEKINTHNVLTFKEEEFFFSLLNKNQEPEILFSGIHFFDKNTLLLYDYEKSPDCPHYKIINLIDNEFLVVEVYLKTEKKDDYKSANQRILYQRQNMKATDRVFTEKKAEMMLKEEPQDTQFTASSAAGVWQMIYTYGDFLTNYMDLQPITSGNTLELKEDGAFYRTYPSNMNENDTGRYFVNGIQLSLYSEEGREYIYNIINLFDGEYMVTERVLVQQSKNKTQRFLYRRIPR
jgi:hypothetical protein